MIIARIAGMANPKIRSIAAAVAAACAVCASIARSRAAAPPAIPAAGRAAINAYLRQAVDDHAVPAVTIVVVNRDQQLLLDAAGKRDAAKKVDVTPDSIFRIASMTKPITSLAVMMLSETGRIGLDDPVTKYLPEFGGVRVMTSFNEA